MAEVDHKVVVRPFYKWLDHLHPYEVCIKTTQRNLLEHTKILLT
jgi:hypothetical protein